MSSLITFILLERFEVGSLNRDKRKKELIKITVENQAILKRLQEKLPTYSVNKWNQEYRKNEELKMNLLEYPVNNVNPMALDAENMEGGAGYELPRI